MKMPVTAYGHPILRKVARPVDKGDPDVNELIDNMFETMYHTNGVGLAAPQVNRSVRIFLVDATSYEKEYPEVKGFKKVFINPEVIRRGGKDWKMDEGCLSVPGINEAVQRPDEVTIHYYDQNWEAREETYSGILGRIIQHEYDHLEGILFTDHLSPLKKTLLRRKLRDIAHGKAEVDYRMLLPQIKKKQ